MSHKSWLNLTYVVQALRCNALVPLHWGSENILSYGAKMDRKLKLAAGSFGAKVFVYATVTVPTTGYELTLLPTVGKPGELDLTLIAPALGTPVGDIVSHPQTEATIFTGESKVTVNFEGKAHHVTVKPITT
jgi:hypothetical protein